MNLYPKQLEAFNAMMSGKNVFLTGPGGVGKTECVNAFVKRASGDKKIAITATTGCAALLIGGFTIHSYTGIGIGTGDLETTLKIIYKSPAKQRWLCTDILIIDEISMLAPDIFDKLEQIARIIRRTPLPFGGIQLILSGDFCQLPCVQSDAFCFEAESWKRCVGTTVYLTQIIRQKNIVFQKCLNQVRMGEISDEVIDVLKKCVGKKLKLNGVTPTQLFSHNKCVDDINNQYFSKLEQKGLQVYEYEIEVTVAPKTQKDKLKKACPAPEILRLCVGSQVMLLYNMDFASGFVNGSRGVVTRFDEDSLPFVRFTNGVEMLVQYHEWITRDQDDKIVFSASQIPLRLAYAVSIHKSQGCSLDCAIIDLSKIFEYGQGYVALSRVRNLEGLSIKSLDPSLLQAHPKAIEFYSSI